MSNHWHLVVRPGRDGADTSGDQVPDVTFQYDVLHRRVARVHGSADAVYVHAGNQVVAEYRLGGLPSVPQQRYVWGDYIDEPILKQSSGLGASTLYYHHNQQYSTVALTNSSGEVVERYAYTAYGELLITDFAGTPRASTAHGNRYVYTGREWDDAVKLYYFRARWYEPGLGRFLGRDPLEYVDGLNLYSSYFSPAELDPTGEDEAHHPYPLHLGGHPTRQTCVKLPEGVHDGIHRYFSARGYGRGDLGRTNWAKLNKRQQAQIIRESLRHVCVDEETIRELMKDAFRGAQKGTNMSPLRARGGKCIVPKALGACALACATLPYEAYVACADDIKDFGIRTFLCQKAQWLFEQPPFDKTTEATYHEAGIEYHLRIVPRADPRSPRIIRCYIIAYHFEYDEDGNVTELIWDIPDSQAICPAVRSADCDCER